MKKFILPLVVIATVVLVGCKGESDNSTTTDSVVVLGTNPDSVPSLDSMNVAAMDSACRIAEFEEDGNEDGK